MRVGIIDYGSGNFASVWNAFLREGKEPVAVAAAAIRGVSDRLSTIPFGQRGRHAFMLHYDAALQHELKG